MWKRAKTELILSLSLHIVPGCPAVSFIYRCFNCGLQKHTPISEKGKRKKTLFFHHHRQRSGMYHSEGKGDCSDQCCCDTHKKNIVSMLVYKIYNRFILVCWCEKYWILVLKKITSTNMLIVSAVPPQSLLSDTRSTLQNRVILTSTYTQI